MDSIPFSFHLSNTGTSLFNSGPKAIVKAAAVHLVHEHWAQPAIPGSSLAPLMVAQQENVGESLLHRANYGRDLGENFL